MGINVASQWDGLWLMMIGFDMVNVEVQKVQWESPMHEGKEGCGPWKNRSPIHRIEEESHALKRPKGLAK